MALSASFADLLKTAVTEPGVISGAYTAFHPYSIGNQLLAWAQCVERGLTPGPLATYPRWKALGRWVRKGERALVLCMPITVKRTSESGDEDAEIFTRFVYRPHWFVLAQTDGQPVSEPLMPTWEKERALTALNVEEIPFAALDGNCLGFARGRSIAINPVNPMPHKTRFHELAHVVLGHTIDGELSEGERTARDLRECEAEAVALLCCAALDLPGVEHCRGYIQLWWGEGNPIPDRSAQRVLRAADQILKAGVSTTESGTSRQAESSTLFERAA